MRVLEVEVEAHQILILLFSNAKKAPLSTSVCAKVNQGPSKYNPIQLVITSSIKH